MLPKILTFQFFSSVFLLPLQPLASQRRAFSNSHKLPAGNLFFEVNLGNEVPIWMADAIF